MKFILDADIPRSFFSQLQKKGYDVIDVRDISKTALKDEEVFAIARKEGRILITRDLDFSNILRYPPQPTHGIIVLRAHLLSSKEMWKIIEELLDKVTEDQLQGTLVIAQRDRLRFYR